MVGLRESERGTEHPQNIYRSLTGGVNKGIDSIAPRYFFVCGGIRYETSQRDNEAKASTINLTTIIV